MDTNDIFSIVVGLVFFAMSIYFNNMIKQSEKENKVNSKEL